MSIKWDDAVSAGFCLCYHWARVWQLEIKEKEVFFLVTKGSIEKPLSNWAMGVTLTLWCMVCALRWEIMHLITPFLMLPFFIVCLVTASIIFIAGLIRAMIYWRKCGVFRPVWIRLTLAVLFTASIFAPLDSMYEKARFSMLATSFDNAAQEVVETSIDTYVVSLPLKYTGLSRGGEEVIVSGEGANRIVLFFSYRGILDNYSVYAYAPNEQAYENLLQYEPWIQMIPLRESWYFCASTRSAP